MMEAIDRFTIHDLVRGNDGHLAEETEVAFSEMLIRPLRQCLLATPNPILPRAGGERIGKADVERIEQATEIFRQWDIQNGGGLLRKAVTGQLNEVNNLVARASYTEHVGCRLLSAVADLAHLAGWMSHDVGLHVTGQQYLAFGLHAAKEANDQPLAAQILTNMARQMNHVHRPQDGLDLIRLARYGAESTLTATMRAMLHVEEAWMLAGMGWVQDCHRAAGLAQETFTDSRPAEDPAWMSYFTKAELLAVTGAAYRDLAWRDPAHADQAASLLTQAVDGYGPDFARSRALTQAVQASAYALQGDYARAHAVTDQTLEVASTLNSTRVHDRFQVLHSHLAGQKHREAHDLRDKLTIALSSTINDGRVYKVANGFANEPF